MIKSVAKALDIMELLAQSGEPVNLSVLADQLGQNINTVKGLLNTLMDKGYVRQESNRGGYCLGGRVLFLAEAMDFENSLKKTAYSYLEKLHDLSGHEAVYCSMISSKQFLCLEYIDSEHELGIRPGKAYRITENLQVYSQGKLILANFTEAELGKYLKGKVLKALTPNSITDEKVLRKELLQIRKTGLAMVRDESAIGICSLAAGIYNRDGGLVATIAVSIPTSRFPEDYEKKIGRKLVEFAEEISGKLLDT